MTTLNPHYKTSALALKHRSCLMRFDGTTVLEVLRGSDNISPRGLTFFALHRAGLGFGVYEFRCRVSV